VAVLAATATMAWGPVGPALADSRLYPAQELFTNASFESGTTGWGAGNASISMVPTYGGAREGQQQMRVANTVAQASLAQLKTVTVYAGDTYRCSLWVRTVSTPSVRVQLTLWGLDGGFQESGGAPVRTVGPTWTQLSAVLYARTSHPRMKCELYLTDAVSQIYVDAASLTRTGVTNPSFERGLEGWTWGHGDPNRPVWSHGLIADQYTGGVAREGWSVAQVTSTNGATLATTPVVDTSGQDTRCTMWVRKPGVNTAATVRLYGIRDASSGSNIYAYVADQVVQGSTAVSDNAWTRVSVVVPRFAGPTSVRCELSLPLNTTFYVDSASLAQEPLTNAGLESPYGWFGGNGAINVYAPANHVAPADGSGYVSISTPEAGRSLAQDLWVSAGSHRCSLWVQSKDAAGFSAQLSVWDLNRGVHAWTDVWVGPAWTEVSTELDFAWPSTMRCELYLNTIDRSLYVDSASTT
jgi:hypothetical protein